MFVIIKNEPTYLLDAPDYRHLYDALVSATPELQHAFTSIDLIYKNGATLAPLEPISLPSPTPPLFIIPSLHFQITIKNFSILIDFIIDMSNDFNNEAFIKVLLDGCLQSLAEVIWLTPIVASQLDIYGRMGKACTQYARLLCAKHSVPVYNNTQQALPYYLHAFNQFKQALTLSQQLIPQDWALTAQYYCDMSRVILGSRYCGSNMYQKEQAREHLEKAKKIAERFNLEKILISYKLLMRNISN